MRKRKTPEEKRLEKIQLDRFYQERYNRSIKKKAESLNKIMNGRDVKQVKYAHQWFTVYFKNGQVFNFTFLPPHIFRENKILPVLEEGWKSE